MLQKKIAVAIVITPEVATVEKSLRELLKVWPMTATAGQIWEHKGETDSDYPIPGLFYIFGWDLGLNTND